MCSSLRIRLFQGYFLNEFVLVQAFNFHNFHREGLFTVNSFDGIKLDLYWLTLIWFWPF